MGLSVCILERKSLGEIGTSNGQELDAPLSGSADTVCTLACSYRGIVLYRA